MIFSKLLLHRVVFKRASKLHSIILNVSERTNCVIDLHKQISGAVTCVPIYLLWIRFFLSFFLQFSVLAVLGIS